ncbi:thioredoxin reductase [Cytobacillus purgationiresistens]|uniref:Thioredoxin reductase n=2 Tax=Cytobacillus purgationiresistens TaxID=863449 RepID=A0ABU0AK62_9BACI|nr:thioredoxin reductase [Cytobacillus purgationiresistens]
MIYDCIVIGAGPAGLSATLTLGRARRNVAVIDNGTNRNRITKEAHGYLTRDNIKPEEFRQIGLSELRNYPSISVFQATVNEIKKDEAANQFLVHTADGQKHRSEKIILATGVQEEFKHEDVRGHYGISLFSCPYCDGWELRDQPLVIIAEEEEHANHLTKLVYNWSTDLVVATNGGEMAQSNKDKLESKGILLKTEPIKSLHGKDGYLEEIEFISGERIQRKGGFVAPSFYRPNHFLEQLGCDLDESGAAVTDGAGRTSQNHIYIAGETEQGGSTSLLFAAAAGSKAAFAVNMDLTTERF